MTLRVVVIVGPTAVGKTRLGVRIAHSLGSEIISADSRQVYRGLDIGSAKPAYPHHLVDICDPAEAYSAARFARDARAAIEDREHPSDALGQLAAVHDRVDLAVGEKLTVVASTSIIGDVVANVGGEVINLAVLIGFGQDPHSYRPAARDLATVADSHIIFVNGWDLEEGLVADLENVAPGDVVLLHGCCHNPTGANLTYEQMAQVISLMQKKQAVPLVDIAYQGLQAVHIVDLHWVGSSVGRSVLLALITTCPDRRVTLLIRRRALP